MTHHSTVMHVDAFDDLDMAWLYYAQGWSGVYLQIDCHHGAYSWLVWK